MTGRLDDLDDPDYPAYTTGRAADVLGVRQAFLRALDTAGAVTPQRTAGGRRRYTRRQLAFAARIRELLDQGHTLAAALRILALEDDLAAERALTARLHDRLGGQDPREGGPGQAGLPAGGGLPGAPGPGPAVRGPRRRRAGRAAWPARPAAGGFPSAAAGPGDTRQVHTVGGQRADLVQPVDVPPGVPAGAAAPPARRSAASAGCSPASSAATEMLNRPRSRSARPGGSPRLAPAGGPGTAAPGPRAGPA